jgi:predicted  nucleic acid-binding Zn-ribbon protein
VGSATCVAGLALLMSGCEQHNQLANQIADVRIELDTVQRAIGQTESEMTRMTREENDLRSQVPLRLGSETTVRKNNLMRADIENLKKRKADLETSLPLFQADLESYRKKYL